MRKRLQRMNMLWDDCEGVLDEQLWDRVTPEIRNLTWSKIPEHHVFEPLVRRAIEGAEDDQ